MSGLPSCSRGWDVQSSVQFWKVLRPGLALLHSPSWKSRPGEPLELVPLPHAPSLCMCVSFLRFVMPGSVSFSRGNISTLTSFQRKPRTWPHLGLTFPKTPSSTFPLPHRSLNEHFTGDVGPTFPRRPPLVAWHFGTSCQSD